MLKLSYLLLIISVYYLTIIQAKRRATVQSQHNLGDFCMPGTCATINSNCKRIGGNAFRCVCKEQYMAINKTYCVKVINASIDDGCASCIQRNGICLDENSDDQMDKCFCLIDNDLCNNRTTAYFLPVTQSFRKTVAIITPSNLNQINKQGDLILSLYDVNQQRLIENGGSVSIGDRLYIEIKYRIDDYELDAHQIIVENCSISSSVSDNELKLEKIQLLTNRCPSIDSRSSIRFQRFDPYHLKSTIFTINKFQSTSIVYLRCSIGICSGRIDNCQDFICPDNRRPIWNNRKVNYSSVDENDENMNNVVLKRRIVNEQKHKFARLLTDLSKSFDLSKNNYEIREVQQQFSIESSFSQPINKQPSPYEALYARTSLSTQSAVERSAIISAISIIFIIGISISLFIVYRKCYEEDPLKIYGSATYAGFSNGADSIYGGLRNPSQICRYDMGRRSEQHFDESFFRGNVEPLGAYRRQY